jgi:hypothetical protein
MQRPFGWNVVCSRDLKGEKANNKIKRKDYEVDLTCFEPLTCHQSAFFLFFSFSFSFLFFSLFDEDSSKERGGQPLE